MSSVDIDFGTQFYFRYLKICKINIALFMKTKDILNILSLGMFYIKFLNQLEYPKEIEIEPNQVLAEIRIDSFSETLVIPMFECTKHDYYQQWRTALHLLTSNDNSTAALITEIPSAHSSEHAMTWPLYRAGDDVYVQNRIVFKKHFPNDFTLDKLTNYVDPRLTHDEENNKISEWRTDMNEVKLWLKDLEQE